MKVCSWNRQSLITYRFQIASNQAERVPRLRKGSCHFKRRIKVDSTNKTSMMGSKRRPHVCVKNLTVSHQSHSRLPLFSFLFAWSSLHAPLHGPHPTFLEYGLRSSDGHTDQTCQNLFQFRSGRARDPTLSLSSLGYPTSNSRC